MSGGGWLALSYEHASLAVLVIVTPSFILTSLFGSLAYSPMGHFAQAEDMEDSANHPGGQSVQSVAIDGEYVPLAQF